MQGELEIVDTIGNESHLDKRASEVIDALFKRCTASIANSQSRNDASPSDLLEAAGANEDLAAHNL